VAGTVAAVGENVNSWSVGQPVCALTNGGGYSEYCVVPASQCLPIPSTLDFIQAAALPEAAFTVWGNVFAPERGNLAPGETFLVHGGSSGIGTLAIQMAAAMGATVYATAGSEEKCAACLELGASEAINYRKAEFADEIKRLTDGKGVDVILDMVGGASVSKNIRSLKRDGRLVFIAFIEGSKTDLDLMPVMLKRLRITGSTLRAQSAEQKARIADALRETIWPLIEAKLIAPVIFKTLPLEKVAEAHKLMESNKHIGKIVLDVATG